MVSLAPRRPAASAPAHPGLRPARRRRHAAHARLGARPERAAGDVHLQPLPVRQGDPRAHRPRRRELAGHGIGSIAVMSNDPTEYPEDSFENMRRSRRGGFTFPYVLDATQEVARAYDAVCTPEFFGFNAALETPVPRPLDASTAPVAGATRAVRRDGRDRRGRAGAGRADPSSVARSSGRPGNGRDAAPRRPRSRARRGQATRSRYACHVAWPMTGTATTRPTNQSAKPSPITTAMSSTPDDHRRHAGAEGLEARQHGDDAVGVAVHHHRHRHDAIWRRPALQRIRRRRNKRTGTRDCRAKPPARGSPGGSACPECRRARTRPATRAPRRAG